MKGAESQLTHTRTHEHFSLLFMIIICMSMNDIYA